MKQGVDDCFLEGRGGEGGRAAPQHTVALTQPLGLSDGRLVGLNKTQSPARESVEITHTAKGLK